MQLEPRDPGIRVYGTSWPSETKTDGRTDGFEGYWWINYECKLERRRLLKQGQNGTQVAFRQTVWTANIIRFENKKIARFCPTILYVFMVAGVNKRILHRNSGDSRKRTGSVAIGWRGCQQIIILFDNIEKYILYRIEIQILLTIVHENAKTD